MTHKLLVLLIVPFVFNLYGCASIVTGQHQVVSVTTPMCPDAECTLTNPEGSYYVKTPGSVTIDREYGDLTVDCKKEGHEPVNMKVSSSTKGMAFGNILLGGVVGAGVDMATGAAYDYPSEIINPLDCRSVAQIADAPTTGHYDKEALALIDTSVCEVPGFVVKDGNEEIYRSQCLDGKIGVITCSNGSCRPANISAPADGKSLDTPTQYTEQVQKLGNERQCTEDLRVTDITETMETWMAKCPTGKFIVIKCTDGVCTERG